MAGAEQINRFERKQKNEKIKIKQNTMLTREGCKPPSDMRRGYFGDVDWGHHEAAAHSYPRDDAAHQEHPVKWLVDWLIGWSIGPNSWSVDKNGTVRWLVE